MILYDISWYYTAFLWPFDGLLWQNVDQIRLESSFLAVIDPNSFGLELKEPFEIDQKK